MLRHPLAYKAIIFSLFDGFDIFPNLFQQIITLAIYFYIFYIVFILICHFIFDSLALHYTQIQMQKNIKKNKTVEQTYQKKTPLEHVLLRPDTYVGSIEPETTKMWVLNQEEDIFEYNDITYTPGLYKIFDQILVNAADNYHRCKDMNRLDVEIDPVTGMISVENNGKGIPVTIHKQEKIFVPHLIFGNLLTGSNYDDDQKKVVGGRNGYGAKLANIFSTKFVVECGDSENKLLFKMTWRQNMMQHDEPQITKFNQRDFTKITFYPEFRRFHMQKMDNDICSLLKKRVYDMAGILPGVKVTLNKKKIECNTFDKYISMYLGTKSTYPRIRDRTVDSDRWQVVISFSEGDFKQVSFVNSICTSKGGTHVNYIMDQIVKEVKARIKKKDKTLDPKPNLIKSHLWIFLTCSIQNPTFDSQTKQTLTLKKEKFGSECELSEKMIKEIVNSGIVSDIIREAKAQDLRAFAKKAKGGKRTKISGIPKLEDANKAGTKQGHKCTLILTEGDSAKGTAMSGLQVVGRDYYGVFPLKGKLLNVRQASLKKMTENAQIQNIIKILGLQIGAKPKEQKGKKDKGGANKSQQNSEKQSQEQQFMSGIKQTKQSKNPKAKQSKQNEDLQLVVSSQESFKKLRYGSVLIMTDQDTDGSHIKGLIINFIHTFWPQLFKRPGFLRQFITPIVKVTKGRQSHAFYTLQNYRLWIQEVQNINTWKIKYYKGLGTSTDQEAKQYFQDLQRHKIDFQYIDQADDQAIEMVFSKNKINNRKQWLANYNPDAGMQYAPTVRYKNFVDNELIHFSNYDNIRSICNIMDGFKPGQRKIMFSCFKRNLVKEIKVAQLSGYVSENSAYHHGEMSLGETIVGLAQNFVGSNNINLLMPNGQYGSRMCGGKSHASPRYIFTALNKITRFIFPEPDDHVLTYIEDDGQMVEPEFYVPIIPMSLVNGCSGIGTGWSTYIPNHNPRQIAKVILNKLKRGQQFPELLPWYKGYSGDITKTDQKTVSCPGRVELDQENHFVHIKQLCIGKWTSDYKEFLQKRIQSKDYANEIISFNEYHTKSKVHFQIEMNQSFFDKKAENEQFWVSYFKVAGNINLTNMVGFTHQKKIKKYDSAVEILNQFYVVRYKFYEKRKDYLLSRLQRQCCVLQQKQKFIMAFINDQIKMKNVKKINICQQLKKMGFIKEKDIPKVRSTKVHKITKKQENQQGNTEEEKSEEQQEILTLSAKDYDYLLGMPMYSMTKQKVQQIQKQLQNKLNQLKSLVKVTVEMMWIEDLEVFLKELDIVEDLQTKQREKQEAKGNKNKAKKGKKAVKPRAKKTDKDQDQQVSGKKQEKKIGKGKKKKDVDNQEDQDAKKVKKTGKKKDNAAERQKAVIRQQQNSDYITKLQKRMNQKREQAMKNAQVQIGYKARPKNSDSQNSEFEMVKYVNYNKSKKKKKMQVTDDEDSQEEDVSDNDEEDYNQSDQDFSD